MDGVELNCAGCGEANLHHYRTEVYERGEDAVTGLKVVIDGGKLDVDYSMAECPSPRRDGVRILHKCEHCRAITALEIVQHKGTTYLTTKRTPPSIVHPDTWPDENVGDIINRIKQLSLKLAAIESGDDHK